MAGRYIDDVKDAHEELCPAAKVARDHADEGAEDDGDDQGDSADGHGGAGHNDPLSTSWPTGRCR